MPFDAFPEIDDLDVYEHLPDFIMKSLGGSATQDVMCDPSTLTWEHSFGRFAQIGHFEATQRMKFLRKVASHPAIGRYFDQAHPILRAILPNKERLEAVYDTVSPDGPAFVMRVPGAVLTLPEMVDRGSITSEMCDFLNCVAGERNVVAAGTAGTGKTTMLRAICEVENVKRKRIISIESDPEIQTPQNGIRLIDIEPEPGMQKIDFMRLLRSALRLLPEMVIVSEILNAEHAFAFVHAARGHIGMSSIHARHSILAPRAVHELGKMAGGCPAHDVAAACDIVVQLEKDGRGGRRVSEIVTIDVDNHGGFVANKVA